MPFIRWKEEKNERIPESDTRDCGNRLFSADPALCKKEDAFPEIHAALVVFRVCDGDAGAVPRPAGCRMGCLCLPYSLFWSLRCR